MPKDPWKNDYQYRSPGEHGEYDLLSYGRDGRPGGEGEDADLVSW
ncbi:type II secretion system protein GspG [Roseateles sp. GG27B]